MSDTPLQERLRAKRDEHRHKARAFHATQADWEPSSESFGRTFAHFEASDGRSATYAFVGPNRFAKLGSLSEARRTELDFLAGLRERVVGLQAELWAAQRAVAKQLAKERVPVRAIGAALGLSGARAALLVRGRT